MHCCGRSSQPCVRTSSSSGRFSCVLCQECSWKLGREDALPAASLTTSFLLPWATGLAAAFKVSLSSHWPLLLLMRTPMNPFQALLPLWNLGGNRKSWFCFILWNNLFWSSIWCSEKNPWTKHDPDTGSYHFVGSYYFSLLSFLISIMGAYGNSQLVSMALC